MKSPLLCVLVWISLLGHINAGVFDWIFGEDSEPKEMEDHSMGSSLGKLAKVPFEMRTADEKFLVEASKFGLQSSDLDLCHHKVVMQLKKTCSSLTEEDIGKLSVHLLNCQSSVEGRRTYKCTEPMSLKHCTSEMDQNTWNAYHIVSNRARAVCYAARQQLFSAKTEMTVNKLVYTSEHQLLALQKLEDGQLRVGEMTSKTLDTMLDGQKELAHRQERLKQSQQHIQNFVHGNLRELTREKSLIAAGQKELASMTEAIQTKLDLASKQLESNEDVRKSNHQEILKDLLSVQEKAKEMWDKIDNSTASILQQHTEAVSRYEETLDNLKRINSTVLYLLQLVDKTRKEVDVKLGWVANILWDTGDRLIVIYSCIIHGVYFLFCTILSCFLNAPPWTRVFVLVLVPLNALSEIKQQASFDLSALTLILALTAFAHWLIYPIKKVACAPVKMARTLISIQNYVATKFPLSIQFESLKEKYSVKTKTSLSFPHKFVRAAYPITPMKTIKENENLSLLNSFDESFDEKTTPSASTPKNESVLSNAQETWNTSKDLSKDQEDGILASFQSGSRASSFTRNRNRSGTPKLPCQGLNKSGMPCKVPASSGKDFCYHHSIQY